MVIRVNLLVNIPEGADEKVFNHLLRDAYDAGKVIVLHDKINEKILYATIRTVSSRKAHARDLETLDEDEKKKKNVPVKKDKPRTAGGVDQMDRRILAKSNIHRGHKRSKVSKSLNLKKNDRSRGYK